MKDLSVIIVTRNRVEKLKRCIDSIIRTLPGSEIVVVDNGSSDDTQKYIFGFEQCEYVRVEKNIGAAAGRNLGLKKAKNDYVIFIDDDAWIGSLDVNSIINYMELHPNIGIVAPKLLYPNGKVQESVRSFPTFKAIFWRGIGLYKIWPNVNFYKNYVNADLNAIKTVDWAISAFLITRKDIVATLNGFDKRQIFLEDADICYRLKSQKKDVLFWPDSVIYHDYARTSARIGKPLLLHIYSIARFFLKRARIIS